MRTLLLLPLLALAGCVQPMDAATRNAHYTSRCEMMGARTEAQLFQCKLALEQSDAQVYELQRQRRSAALIGMGNAILAGQQANQPPIRTPVTTNCRQYGRTLSCSSY